MSGAGLAHEPARYLASAVVTALVNNVVLIGADRAGFGYAGAGGLGARAVLEVRSREVPFILEHGQVIGRLVFERLTDPPREAYGQGIGSNYQRQGLKLSKHFREPR